MAEQRNEHLSGAGKDAKQRVSGATDEARRFAEEKADTWRKTVMGTVDDVAEALDAAAGSLRGREPWLADATADLSQNVRHFAESGQSRSFDQLRHDLEGAARRNPTLFMIGALAAGVGISRFLKSSPPAHHVSHREGGEPAPAPVSRTPQPATPVGTPPAASPAGPGTPEPLRPPAGPRSSIPEEPGGSTPPKPRKPL